MKILIILFITSEKSFITLGIEESMILALNFMKCPVQILSFWSVFNDNSNDNLCFRVLYYTAKRGLSLVNCLATFTTGGPFFFMNFICPSKLEFLIITIYCMLLKLRFMWYRIQLRSQNCEKRQLASSCLSVCPYICPSAWLQIEGYSWNFIFENFKKFCKENSSFSKSDRNNNYRVAHEKPAHRLVD